MNQYRRIEDERIDRVPWRRRHTLALCAGVLSTGVLLLSCKIVPGGLSLISVSHKPKMQATEEFENLVSFPSQLNRLRSRFVSAHGGRDGHEAAKPSHGDIFHILPAYPLGGLLMHEKSTEEGERHVSNMCRSDVQKPVATSVFARRTATLGMASAAMALFLQDARALEDATEEQKQIQAALDDFRAPPVFTKSDDRSIRLAKHLNSVGAVLYGAFWCSHCYDQKQTFGKEAASMLNYVECDKRSQNSGNQLCKDKQVKGYPTWEINGKLYSGDQSLEELEKISKAV